MNSGVLRIEKGFKSCPKFSVGVRFFTFNTFVSLNLCPIVEFASFVYYKDNNISLYSFSKKNTELGYREKKLFVQFCYKSFHEIYVCCRFTFSTKRSSERCKAFNSVNVNNATKKSCKKCFEDSH